MYSLWLVHYHKVYWCIVKDKYHDSGWKEGIITFQTNSAMRSMKALVWPTGKGPSDSRYRKWADVFVSVLILRNSQLILTIYVQRGHTIRAAYFE